MSELKPCPFCGEKPTVKQAGTTRYWWVGCEIHLDEEPKGCGVSRSSYDRQVAIDRWNTRDGSEHLATQAALKSGIDGWVIIHPDGRVETDYFKVIHFKTKLDGYKKTVTPEFWRLTYRPDCKLIKMRLVDLSNPLTQPAANSPADHSLA